MPDPHELVDRIFDTHPIEATRDRLMQCMIEVSRRLPALPEVAARGLDVAERYWRGRASQAELVQARVACWQFIASIGAGTDTDDARARATRAAICALYEDWASTSHDDAFDLMCCFVEFVEGDEHERARLVAHLQTVLDRPT